MEEKKKRQKRTNSRRGKFVAGAYKNLGPSFSLSLIAPPELSAPMVLLLYPGPSYCRGGHVKRFQSKWLTST